MSGEFDSRKDSHSTKFEGRLQIFVRLSFRELYDSKLSGLYPFDNMAVNSKSDYKFKESSFALQGHKIIKSRR